MYLGKMFIAWMKMLMVLILYMIDIHIKIYEDGKNDDQEVGKGSLQASRRFQLIM